MYIDIVFSCLEFYLLVNFSKFLCVNGFGLESCDQVCGVSDDKG